MMLFYIQDTQGIMQRKLTVMEYLIISNGAEVYGNINKKVLKIKQINTEYFMKIYTYAQSNNIWIVVTSENKEFLTNSVRNDSQYLLLNNNREVEKLI